MRLSEWARREGIHYTTAWRWWRAGKLPVPARQTATGTILVEVEPRRAGRLVVYARVSSHAQRVDLDRQVARVTQWATRQGLAVDEVIGEVGSGLDGKRPRLRRLLADPRATTIVVESRDRGRVRFTTGAMRLEPDRRHLTVPVIGRLRSKENTRRLQRLLANGRARILSMTLSEHGGRL